MSIAVAVLRLTWDAERARSHAPGKLGDLLAGDETEVLDEILADASEDELRSAVRSLAMDVVDLAKAGSVNFEQWIVQRGAAAVVQQ